MRIRLTLAFTAVMALVLVAVGLFVYSRVGSDLDAALDTSLRSRADDLAALAGGGRLSASRLLNAPTAVVSSTTVAATPPSSSTGTP